MFGRFAEFLKIYSMYCSNHEASVTLLRQRMDANPQLAQFAHQQRLLPQCRQRDLESFLIMPVQRLCKYPLLLRELLHATPKSRPEYTTIEEALGKIVATVQRVNEFKRRWEDERRVLDIQQRVVGAPSLLAPNRHLVKEGVLRELVTRGNQDLIKDAHLFLFNDLLLVTRVKPPSKVGGLIGAKISEKVGALGALSGLSSSSFIGGGGGGGAGSGSGLERAQLKYKDSIPLMLALVTNLNDGATRAALRNAFEILCRQLGGRETKHIFFSAQPAEKEAWLQVIQQLTGEAVLADDSDDDDYYGDQSDADQPAAAVPASAPASSTYVPESQVPAPWEVHYTEDGDVYYYNPETDVSVWNIPA